MIDTNISAAQFSSIHVVDCQHSAELVLEADEAETHRAASLGVTHEVHVYDLTKLTEDNHQITLVHFIIKATDVDVSWVSVVVVPTRGDGREVFQILVAEFLNAFDLVVHV